MTDPGLTLEQVLGAIALGTFFGLAIGIFVVAATWRTLR